MVTICPQCGVHGWPNAFVYCVKCLKDAVHRYCLDKVPETFDEFVPWVCDNCEAESGGVKLQKCGAGTQGNTTSEHIKVNSIEKVNKKNIRQFEAGEKRGHDRSGLVLQSAHEKLDSTEYAQVASIVHNDSCHTEPVENEPRCQTNSSQYLHEVRAESPSRGEKLKKSNDMLPLISGKEKQSQPSDGAGFKIVRAEPLVDPVWRGTFNIINKDVLKGLVGHLSSRACRLVYDEVSLLPSLLHLEILPKAAVWPKRFAESDPTDDNIALYIFPAERRYGRTFDQLVGEMTQQELAMKAITENAELLIFTSTELPLLYWRFQKKQYLWGVFRAKPSSSSPFSQK